MRRFWYKLLGLHPDGTEHQWKIGPAGTHWCEWDYCHCRVRTCSMCETKQLISDGSVEMR